MTWSSRRALLVLRLLLGALLVAAVARVALFTVYRVSGASMEDALHDGDRILVCDVPWLLQGPDPGDTIIARVEGEVLVKRVVAGPGDTIAILFGTLVRNGAIVEEFIAPQHKRLDTMLEHRMGADEYFLMGDHRNVSVDSREFGPVRSRQIIGRVLLRLSADGITPVQALETS